VAVGRGVRTDVVDREVLDGKTIALRPFPDVRDGIFFVCALAKAGVTAQGLNAAIDRLRGGRTADTQASEDRYDALKRFSRE